MIDVAIDSKKKVSSSWAHEEQRMKLITTIHKSISPAIHSVFYGMSAKILLYLDLFLSHSHVSVQYNSITNEICLSVCLFARIQAERFDLGSWNFVWVIYTSYANLRKIFFGKIEKKNSKIPDFSQKKYFDILFRRRRPSLKATEGSQKASTILFQDCLWSITAEKLSWKITNLIGFLLKWKTIWGLRT